MNRGRGVLSALSLLVWLGAWRPAHAFEKPGWVKDLEAKAEDWKNRLESAWGRVEAAADAAQEKVGEDMRRRIAEAKEALRQAKEALEQVLAQQKREWEGVILARLEQATTLAEELAADLEGIIAGTVTGIRFQGERLVSGVRAAAAETYRQAGVKLSEARLVDDTLVTQAVALTRSRGVFWGGVLTIVFGLLVAGIAVPTLGRRRLVLAIVAGVVAAGIIGVGIWLLVSKREARQEVVLGVTECAALGDAQALINRPATGGPPPTRAEAQPVIDALEVCKVMAADDSLADVTHRQLATLGSML
jgi:hypothetical protein